MSDIKRAVEKFLKDNNKYPTLIQLEKLGVTRAMVRTEFGNLAGIRKALANNTNIFDLEFSPVKAIPKGAKRFVITTAVTESKVHTGFLNNIKAYCKKKGATFVVIPSLLNSKDGWVLDPVLKNEAVVLNDVSLNSNLFLLGMKNSASKVDPITGLPRVGRRNGTFICASPKQRLKYVATGVHKLPHALMSTGAITTANYIKSPILVDKTSYIANYDHVMGAIIVELDSNNTFHFRQIQADKYGNFCDLGRMWENGKDRAVETTLIAGDWHVNSTDLAVKSATLALTTKLGIKEIIMHDVFDGESINHHEKDKLLVLTKKAQEGKLSLDKELKLYSEELHELSRKHRLVIVRSNHDEFLTGYLNSGDYVKHPYNHRISLILSLSVLDGNNPLEYFHKTEYPKDNIVWLKMDESYKIGGVECGMHGHKGSNGARGSITSMENAYGNVIFGHTHTPEILRGAYCVGTSTYLQLAYNSGASSWLQAHCLLYQNGQRQLINFINGKFHN